MYRVIDKFHNKEIVVGTFKTRSKAERVKSDLDLRYMNASNSVIIKEV